MSPVMSAVQTEAILKELGKLWRTLSKEQGTEKPSAVLRACAMSLIVATEDAADAAVVGETIAALMHEHPSRAIVLRLRDTAEPLLEARVLADCWMPFGRRQQICSERIEITVSRPSLDDVPPAVMGLTVPDLPVVVWVRQARLLDVAEFRQLLPLADKVIVDTGDASDAAAVLARLRELRQSRRNVADLSWTRLTPWRSAVAQLFDNPQNVSPARDYTQAVVRHAPGPVPVAARYLAGWLRTILGPGLSLRYEERAAASGEAVTGIELSGTDRPVSLDLTPDGAMDLCTETFCCRTVRRPSNEYDLLREELSILGRDRLFESVLKAASQEPA